MSSQIPYRFGCKNCEMTEAESANIFLNAKERKTLSKIKQFTLRKIIRAIENQF
jgi:hypothetical protein